MFYKEIYLLFSAQLQFPDRGNDIYLRCKDLKYYIKSHLVVSCSCRAVGNICCTKFLYVSQHLKCLEDSL